MVPRGGLNSVLAAAEREWQRGAGETVLAEAARIAHRVMPGTETAVTTELTFDMIIPTLIDRSARARMIVVGSRGRGALRRTLLGSVSTAITRHACCPVAVVHKQPATAAMRTDSPVLVGADGTGNSTPAIEVAFDEAARRKVGLVALHTWSDTSGYDLPVADRDSVRRTQDLLLAEILADCCARYPEVAVQRVVACDNPVRALLAWLEDAQLLVVGSHGRGGFTGMVLGSTSTALLHLADRPLIVVRP